MPVFEDNEVIITKYASNMYCRNQWKSRGCPLDWGRISPIKLAAQVCLRCFRHIQNTHQARTLTWQGDHAGLAEVCNSFLAPMFEVKEQCWRAGTS